MEKYIEKRIEEEGLEFLCEISSYDKDFNKKLAESLMHNFGDYYLIVPDYAGPEDDIRYKIYRKLIHSVKFNEPL